MIYLSFEHLNLIEREKLYGMLQKGCSHREIARALNRSQSSISREIKRNTKYDKQYLPFYAQKRAIRISNIQRSKAPLKRLDIYLYVREHLRNPFFWSPETISGRISIDLPNASISPESIYQYIYNPKNRRFNLKQYLTFKHNKRRKQNGRSVHKFSKIPNAVSIDYRAKFINKRKQLGHWESDLMEGPRSSKHNVSVTVERSTRYTILSKLSSKQAKYKTNSVVNRLKRFPAQSVKSLTLDNGSENSYHQIISQSLNIKVFFCHPYHSWEKGTVENTIGRIRRYIPKGTDIKQIPDMKIQELEYILNNTPRKCLGYLTPYEKMSKELNKLLN